MKRLALSLLLALAAAGTARAAVVREVSKSFPAASLTAVRATVGVGELRVVRGSDDSVRVTMIARCRRGSGSCARRAGRLRLESDALGSQLRLRLEGYPRFMNHGLETTLRIEVPAAMRLSLHLGVGELAVRDVDGDVEGHLGVGAAEVHASEAAVGAVRLHVGVGDASLRGGRGRRESAGFIGQSLTWREGEGRARVALHVGVGEADVTLR